MTIRKGEPWGIQAAAPPDLLWATSDAAIVTADPSRPVALAGGDLFKSVGSPDRRDPMLRVEVDGLVVTLDGETHVRGIAHVVVRRSWWRGRIVAAMNVDTMGHWNAAPRAHPNDAVFDVVDVDAAFTVRERLAARSRLPAGVHVPHPRITTRRSRDEAWKLERPHDVWVDGVRVGEATDVRVRLEPDRYVVYF